LAEKLPQQHGEINPGTFRTRDISCFFFCFCRIFPFFYLLFFPFFFNTLFPSVILPLSYSYFLLVLLHLFSSFLGHFSLAHYITLGKALEMMLRFRALSI
jgi:hypothetical protein